MLSRLNIALFNFKDSSGHATAEQEVNLNDHQSNEPMDNSHGFPDPDFVHSEQNFDATAFRKSFESAPPLPSSSEQRILPPPPPPPPPGDEDSRSNPVSKSQKDKSKSG
jgi:hypothetical protein